MLLLIIRQAKPCRKQATALKQIIDHEILKHLLSSIYSLSLVLYFWIFNKSWKNLQIEQLQSRLQQERSMRMVLERAMGRASSTLSPGHHHFAAQVILNFVYQTGTSRLCPTFFPEYFRKLKSWSNFTNSQILVSVMVLEEKFLYLYI